MAEIIKVYKEHLPALRLIGKRYTNADRDSNGGYGEKWGEWWQYGWFATLEKASTVATDIENGYLGFMRYNSDDWEKSFEYWIGIFFPTDTVVPEGFECIDLDEGDLGVCWIKGKEDDDSIYGMHDECMKKLEKNNMGNMKADKVFSGYFFERYNCPRFTTPDEEGNIVLDYGVYLA